MVRVSCLINLEHTGCIESDCTLREGLSYWIKSTNLHVKALTYMQKKIAKINLQCIFEHSCEIVFLQTRS